MSELDRLWSLIVLIIDLIRAYFKHVGAVQHLSYTYLGREGNMENYRIQWVSSPSDFVDKLVAFYRLDGGASQQTPDLPASTLEVTIGFPTGATVDLWVITYGDNGTLDESEHLTFNASNKEQVKGVSGLTATWTGHVA
jgi:hypothetical protein